MVDDVLKVTDAAVGRHVAQRLVQRAVCGGSEAREVEVCDLRPDGRFEQDRAEDVLLEREARVLVVWGGAHGLRSSRASRAARISAYDAVTGNFRMWSNQRRNWFRERTGVRDITVLTNTDSL